MSRPSSAEALIGYCNSLKDPSFGHSGTHPLDVLGRQFIVGKDLGEVLTNGEAPFACSIFKTVFDADSLLLGPQVLLTAGKTVLDHAEELAAIFDYDPTDYTIYQTESDENVLVRYLDKRRLLCSYFQNHGETQFVLNSTEALGQTTCRRQRFKSIGSGDSGPARSGLPKGIQNMALVTYLMERILLTNTLPTELIPLLQERYRFIKFNDLSTVSSETKLKLRTYLGEWLIARGKEGDGRRKAVLMNMISFYLDRKRGRIVNSDEIFTAIENEVAENKSKYPFNSLGLGRKGITSINEVAGILFTSGEERKGLRCGNIEKPRRGGGINTIKPPNLSIDQFMGQTILSVMYPCAYWSRVCALAGSCVLNRGMYSTAEQQKLMSDVLDEFASGRVTPPRRTQGDRELEQLPQLWFLD